MTMTLKRLAAAGAFALALGAPLAALADDHGDHDRARDLHEHGEIRALFEILRVVRERVPGDIVAVDLVRLDDKWVYRFRIVDPGGRRVSVDVDAGAAKVLSQQAGD